MESHKVKVERVVLLGSSDALTHRVHYGPRDSAYTASVQEAVEAAADRVREMDPDFQAERWVLFEDRFLDGEILDCVLLGDNLGG